MNPSTKTSTLLVETIPTNLPKQVTSLIGREKELTTLESLLAQKEINLITLTGLGGAGKTSLAMQLAKSALEKFSSGVFFISLASITKPSLIPVEIAHILKIEQAQNKKIIDAIKEFLLGRRILLVLDNFEHLIDGAFYVQELLQSSSNLKIIVTSREALHVRGEQIYPIGALDNEHAFELFTKRAQSLNPNLFISSADKDSIIELCKRLDGLPLAIEIAALRTKLFSPSALLARLKPDLQPASRILNLFSSGARDLPARQQSLRNTIAWSYELLDEQEKKIFRTGSIFPAGFRIDSLAILLNLAEEQVLEIVSSLVDKNLLKSSLEKHAVPYFNMVEMIREFAWDEILRLEELSQLKNAYVNLYAFLTEQADKALRESQQIDLFSRFDDEFANINLALEICVTAPQGSENWVKGYQILNNFHRYWMMYQFILVDTDYLARARKSIDDFCFAEPELSQKFLLHKANIYSLLGTFLWFSGNYAESKDLHEVAYKTYLQIQNEIGVIDSLNNWAANLACLGEYDRAIKLLEESTTLCRRINNRWAEMRNLSNLGVWYQNTDHPEVAIEIFEKGLSIATELKDIFFISAFQHGIANFYVRFGNYKVALATLKSFLEMGSQIQGNYLFAHSLVTRAQANIMLEKLEPAVGVILEAIALSEKISDLDLKIDLLYACVYILVFMGLYQEAIQLIGTIRKNRAETQMQENKYDVQNFKQILEKINASISKDEFASLELIGSKLSLDAALAIAVEVLETPRSTENKKHQPLQLTAREQEVLALIKAGLTNEQISNELVVVLKTVEKHVASIFRKLGVKNRTEAATWAMDKDLLK